MPTIFGFVRNLKYSKFFRLSVSTNLSFFSLKIIKYDRKMKNNALFLSVLVFGVFVCGFATGQIKKETKKVEKSIHIDAPRTKDYSFKIVPKDSVEIEGEQEMKYGDGFSWQEKYPDKDRKYREPRVLEFSGFRQFPELIERAFGNFDLTESLADASAFNWVSIYPNKPDMHILNIDLKTRNHADPVNISVVDVEGNILKKQLIDVSSGDFLGQLELPKNTRGYIFVLISQGDSATSRKVKLE